MDIFGGRFNKLVGLLCKYDNVVPRDPALLIVLKEDIQQEISASDEGVFIKLFKSLEGVNAYGQMIHFGEPPCGYPLATAVNALVRNGFDVQRKDASWNLTALEYVVEHMSSSEGNLDLLRVLLTFGDVNAGYSQVVHHGYVPPVQNEFLILTAVRRGQLEVVNALIAAGAKLNLPPEQPETLAFAAAYGGHPHILKLLIEHKADVKKAVNGQTPLMVAAAGVSQGGVYESRFQQCVELLVPRHPPPPPDDFKDEQKSKKAKVAPPECAICKVGRAEVALIPCGHMCVCSSCVSRAKGKCPVCYASFQSHAKIYFP